MLDVNRWENSFFAETGVPNAYVPQRKKRNIERQALEALQSTDVNPSAPCLVIGQGPRAVVWWWNENLQQVFSCSNESKLKEGPNNTVVAMMFDASGQYLFSFGTSRLNIFTFLKNKGQRRTPRMMEHLSSHSHPFQGASIQKNLLFSHCGDFFALADVYGRTLAVYDLQDPRHPLIALNGIRSATTANDARIDEVNAGPFIGMILWVTSKGFEVAGARQQHSSHRQLTTTTTTTKAATALQVTSRLGAQLTTSRESSFQTVFSSSLERIGVGIVFSRNGRMWVVLRKKRGRIRGPITIKLCDDDNDDDDDDDDESTELPGSSPPPPPPRSCCVDIDRSRILLGMEDGSIISVGIRAVLSAEPHSEISARTVLPKSKQREGSAITWIQSRSPFTNACDSRTACR
eukprot:jgi/Bigna1/69987/fgenesh1_pg.10_\